MAWPGSNHWHFSDYLTAVKAHIAYNLVRMEIICCGQFVAPVSNLSCTDRSVDSLYVFYNLKLSASLFTTLCL